MICVISSFQFLLAELNTFYLKFVLWMPPEHYLVLLRLVFFVNVGGVAMREIYDFMDDPWVLCDPSWSHWGGHRISTSSRCGKHNNTGFHPPDRRFYKKFGQQAWLAAAITVTEFLIVVKYDPHTITLPIPFFIMQCWFLGLILIIFWTVWRFFFR